MLIESKYRKCGGIVAIFYSNLRYIVQVTKSDDTVEAYVPFEKLAPAKAEYTTWR